MKKEPNLLVTFDPSNRWAARTEVKTILEELGETAPEFLKSNVRGLFKIRTKIDPKEVTKKLHGICRSNPSKFWYTYHWTPIERCCRSRISEMFKVVKELAEKISFEESWRFRINKRFYSRYHTKELIEQLAKYVNSPKVDLEHPQKIIQIEIIRGWAGLSLLEPKELFSVNAVKNEILTVKK